MRSTIRLLLTGLALVLLVTTPAAAEWFGDFYAGVAITASSDVSPAGRDTIPGVTYDKSSVIGGRGGYWFERRDFLLGLPLDLGLALDIYHFVPNAPSQVINTSFGRAFFAPVDLDVTAFSPKVMLRYGLFPDETTPHGRLQPYALIGPTFAIAQARDSGNFGRPGARDTASAAGVDVGVGTLWQFHEHLGAFFEYRFVHTTPTFTFSSGDVDVPINSNFLMLGLSYRF